PILLSWEWRNCLMPVAADGACTMTEGGRTGEPRTEVGKTEEARTEGARTEGARTEGARTEGARTEGVMTPAKRGSGYSGGGELLAVRAGRLLQVGQVVFAGAGVPLLAATLAQRTHAPHLTILFEGGAIGPFIVPGELPPSTNEQRCTRRANMLLPITDVLVLFHPAYVD